MNGDLVRLVSVFKEHLIMDDEEEFLWRVYTAEECKTLLTKYLPILSQKFKTLPNYSAHDENKLHIILKNIDWKIKALEEKERYKFYQDAKEFENLHF